MQVGHSTDKDRTITVKLLVTSTLQLQSSKHRAVTPGMCIFKEPLFGNGFVTSQVLSSTSLRGQHHEAGPSAEVFHPSSCWSNQHQVQQGATPADGGLSFPASSPQSISFGWFCIWTMGPSEYVFLSLAVHPSVGQWQPEEENFETIGTHWFLPFHQLRGASSERCSPFNTDLPRPSVCSSSLAGWVKLCKKPQCSISHFAFGASCNLTTTDWLSPVPSPHAQRMADRHTNRLLFKPLEIVMFTSELMGRDLERITGVSMRFHSWSWSEGS